MKLHSLNTGHFKLDGGAMFGVVPKTLWQKSQPADDLNLCSWAMRSMLVEHGDRLILIDTGIGNKQDDKFFGHYHLHGPDNLDDQLRSRGFERADITDVFLTHLHFDHCGGAIERSGDHWAPAFPKARFWSNEAHWGWATRPNPREKASFLAENILPIQESGQLEWIALPETAGVLDRVSTPLGFDCLRVSGHTESMMLPLLEVEGRTVVYLADLIPSAAHIPLAWVMGYDTRPLLTLEEKAALLQQAVAGEWLLFFEHDPALECARLAQTEKGIRLQTAGALVDLW
ncbi:MBL fold metallo-hydrolase [bacterium]|nr:MBL fold metallo-hydrolase [bacterium]